MQVAMGGAAASSAGGYATRPITVDVDAVPADFSDASSTYSSPPGTDQGPYGAGTDQGSYGAGPEGAAPYPDPVTGPSQGYPTPPAWGAYEGDVPAAGDVPSSWGGRGATGLSAEERGAADVAGGRDESGGVQADGYAARNDGSGAGDQGWAAAGRGSAGARWR